MQKNESSLTPKPVIRAGAGANDLCLLSVSLITHTFFVSLRTTTKEAGLHPGGEEVRPQNMIGLPVAMLASHKRFML
jgi:hypothetical protein